jgi:Domain of unknown function (DUF1996)
MRRFWVISLVVIASCSTNSRSGHDHSTHGPGPTGAPDAPITGSQGRVAQFLVECPFSHALADDPIVYPNQAGESHLHMFFGNESANAASTAGTLTEGSTKCDQPADLASYWVPGLYDGETLVTPERSVAYYRTGVGVDPQSVQPYPAGLKIIAGDAAATSAQSVAVVAWTCGVGIERLALPPTCSPNRPLRMLVTFPDCWNGHDLDAADHFSHMAYSSKGECPTTHPVPVPQLQLGVAYGFSGDTKNLSLASGPIVSGHADFFNAWDEVKLASEISNCLHRQVVCGIASDR